MSGLGARGLWNWALPFLIIEALAIVQIARGLFGDLAADAMARIASIEGTLELRRQQLASAIENNTDKIGRLPTHESTRCGGQYRRHPGRGPQPSPRKGQRLPSQVWEFWFLPNLHKSLAANTALEARFSDWISDRSIRSGMPMLQIAFSAIFMALIVAAAVLHYSFPGRFTLLSDFPTDPEVRLTSIAGVEGFFNWAVLNGEALFDAITYCIRLVLDALEIVFVSTPWIVIASLIILPDVADGRCPDGDLFWRIPRLHGSPGLLGKGDDDIGIAGARPHAFRSSLASHWAMFRRRAVRDFTASSSRSWISCKTMPAFVFMIPVIAFFGTGKPAAVVTTMIFGGTPVVRLTVLGLRGVPESVREAAISFGANKWYLLTRVDLPLASPSIRAGINQTIMLSLAMVVVASLIGAKGLGEDVLEALQYANVGQGILAGFSILFCAMILDRIVQGGRR